VADDKKPSRLGYTLSLPYAPCTPSSSDEEAIAVAIVDATPAAMEEISLSISRGLRSQKQQTQLTAVYDDVHTL